MPAASSVVWTFPSAAIFSLVIRGGGLDASVITWTGSDGITLNMSQPGHSFHIQEMSIVTNSVGTNTGLTVTQSFFGGAYTTSGCVRVAFRGTDTAHYWATGCVCTGVTDVNFIQCTGTGAAPGGVNVGVGIICQGTSSTASVIANFTDCSFTFFDEGVVYGDFFQGMAMVGCNWVEVNKGVHQRSGSGASFVGAQLSMNGCQANCNASCILIAGHLDDILISGGNLFYGDIAADAVPIFLTNSSVVQRLSIQGNGFEGAGSSGGTAHAIAIAGFASAILINSNYIYGFTTGVFGVAGSSITFGTINSNVIQGIDTTSNGIDLLGNNAGLSIDGNMLGVLGTAISLGSNANFCNGNNTYSNCTQNILDGGSGNTIT